MTALPKELRAAEVDAALDRWREAHGELVSADRQLTELNAELDDARERFALAVRAEEDAWRALAGARAFAGVSP